MTRGFGLKAYMIDNTRAGNDIDEKDQRSIQLIYKHTQFT